MLLRACAGVAPASPPRLPSLLASPTTSRTSASAAAPPPASLARYCRFFQGRRSHDDARQISRWSKCAGLKGRWRNQLCGRIAAARSDGSGWDDATISPVIRQTLLHWAYELNEADWEAWRQR